MLSESIDALNIKPDGTYLDMTVGGFGHGAAICSMLSAKGTYIGIDLDPNAINMAKEQSVAYKNNFIFCNTHFKRFEEFLVWNGVNKLDGCIMDLGVSSFQLDDSRRGFSFLKESRLDMRMDTSQSLSAFEVVNLYECQRLEDIIREFGEERFAKKIASSIVAARKVKPIETTTELAKLIESTIPRKFHVKGRHAATKSFQAIRIEVNDEIESLGDTVKNTINYLQEGGRFVAISFHSLEDRQVKRALFELSQGCTCPKDFPVCVCGKKPTIKLLSRKHLVPTQNEIDNNPRARSASMRIAEKLIIIP